MPSEANEHRTHVAAAAERAGSVIDRRIGRALVVTKGDDLVFYLSPVGGRPTEAEEAISGRVGGRGHDSSGRATGSQRTQARRKTRKYAEHDD